MENVQKVVDCLEKAASNPCLVPHVDDSNINLEAIKGAYTYKDILNATHMIDADAAIQHINSKKVTTKTCLTSGSWLRALHWLCQKQLNSGLLQQTFHLSVLILRLSTKKV